jgi:hypothetical protein
VIGYQRRAGIGYRRHAGIGYPKLLLNFSELLIIVAPIGNLIRILWNWTQDLPNGRQACLPLSLIMEQLILWIRNRHF